MTDASACEHSHAPFRGTIPNTGPRRCSACRELFDSVEALALARSSALAINRSEPPPGFSVSPSAGRGFIVHGPGGVLLARADTETEARARAWFVSMGGAGVSVCRICSGPAVRLKGRTVCVSGWRACGAKLNAYDL